MLPISLTIQAFGPYVEKEIIDFTDLNHLFLIKGETGSGKTMILDAMSFALYGKSSTGIRESFELMRSRMASDELDTIVDFIFKIDEDYYRFYRKLHVHIKRNQEKEYQYSLDAGWMINGSFQSFFEKPKIALVKAKAEELIGLTYEQFVQVMILPQGQFEAFLTSKSEDKQEILKSLFKVSDWEAIIEYLGNEATTFKQKIDHEKQLIQTYISSLDCKDIEEVEIVFNELCEACKQLAQQKKQLQQREHELKKQLTYQQELNHLQTQLATFTKQFNALIEKSDDIEQKRKQLLKFQAMQAQRLAFQQYQESKSTYEKRESKYLNSKKALEQIDDLSKQIKIIQASLIEINSLKESNQRDYLQYQAISDKLREIKQLEKKLLNVKNELGNNEKLKQKSEEKLALLENSLNQKQKVIDDFEAKEDEYRKLTDKNNSWNNAYYYYQEVQKCQKKMINISSDLDENKQIIIKTQNEYLEISEYHDEQYQKYLDHALLQLADKVEEGKPCPLCGSLDHPHLVDKQAEEVSLQDLKQLKQKCDTKLEELKQIKLDFESLQQKQKINEQQIISLKQQMQSLINQPFDMEKYQGYQKQYQQYQNENIKMQKLRQSLKSEEEAITKQRQALKQFQEQIQVRLGEYNALNQQLEKAQSSVSINEEAIKLRLKQNQIQKQELIQQEEKVMKNKASLEKQILTIKQTYEHDEKEMLEAKSNYEQRKLAYVDKKTNFSDEEMKALISDEAIMKLNNEINHYDENYQFLYHNIENLNNKLKDCILLDIEKLENDYQLIVDEKQKVIEDDIKTNHKKDNFDHVLAKIAKSRLSLNKNEPEYQILYQFMKNLRGDLGVGIERYVLGILLNQISQQANLLLEKVQDGRYQIYRSDDLRKGSRKFGLELEIYDKYSSSARSVTSLSGGEKFLVSLAMSLALSMVVQAQNGGIHFDAMFIDEGFGTLDENSIADALAILNMMSDQKGMIGIISHVELLESNIHSGINVVRARGISKIRKRGNDDV